MGLIILFSINAAVRVWVALHSVFADDERAIYSAAARFYLTGKPATTGARVVYTGTVLPGMLQDLLAGCPLFLTGGWPWLTVVVIALLQTGSAWLLWDAYRRLFPRLNAHALAAFITFAPWTMLYSGFINTSYLSPLSILVFWGVVRAILAQEKRTLQRAAGAIGFGLMAAIQFNLAATFLFAWVGICILVLVARPAASPGFMKRHLSAAAQPFLIGAGTGGLTIVPFVLERVFLLAEGNASAANAKPSLLSNFHFDWNHVQDLYKIFFRFLSFPTGETTRFLGMHRGFAGAIEKMKDAPFLMITGVPTLIVATLMTLLGWRFFFRAQLWRNLVRLRWGVPEMIAFGPLLMMALFMISIKEPSAHALLPFLPLSFYPLLSEWPKRSPSWILPTVSLLGLIFSVGGYLKSYQPSLLDVESAARCAVAQQNGNACSAQGETDLKQVAPENVDLVAKTVLGSAPLQ